MKTADDIESYLIKTETSYDVVGDQIWLVKDGGPDLVLSITGPVVVFRIKLLDEAQIAAGKQEALFRHLLRLNATEMLHGSYGLEEGAVVMTAALQLENLDYNEFQATIEDMLLAAAKHYPALNRYATA
jgi:hypothetical protein